MTRRFALRLVPLAAAVVLLMLAAPAGAGAQSRRQRPALAKTKLAVFHGYVQVFSHAAVTVRDPKNRAELRIFTFSPGLRERLQNRHLIYGEKVAVYYQPGNELAVRLKGKIYPGS